MLAKDKMFRITKVSSVAGCERFIVYKYYGLFHIFVNGSRYGMVSEYSSLSLALRAVELKYISYANSCTKAEEVQVWPTKEEKE